MAEAASPEGSTPFKTKKRLKIHKDLEAINSRCHSNWPNSHLSHTNICAAMVTDAESRQAPTM